MLDQHYGRAHCGEPLDKRVDLLRLGRIESGCRLVEQQHARLTGQRTRDLETLERAVRHRRRVDPRVSFETEKAQQLQRPFTAFVLGTRKLGRVQECRQQTAALAQMAPGHDVLERGHVEKDLQVLERASDAGSGEFVRWRASEIALIEDDAARARHIDPRQQVKQGGLAGAVGADDRMDRPGSGLPRKIVDGAHSAELLRQALDAQRAHRALRSQ